MSDEDAAMWIGWALVLLIWGAVVMVEVCR
jgi:hypothetical protein